MKTFNRILALFVFIVMGYAQPAHATWEDAYGVGVRASAMGGAFAAVADDYAATYYNPAGLGQIKGFQMGVEFMYLKPAIKVENLVTGGDLKVYGADGSFRSDPTEGLDKEGLDFYTPVIGAVIDVNSITDRFMKLPHTSMGILMSLTRNFNNAWRVNIYPPDQPHFISYGDYNNRLSVDIGVGVEGIEKLLYVGGGVGVGINGEGSLGVNNTTLNPDNPAVPLQGGLSLNVTYAPTFGILFTPMDQKLKIGYSYRYRTQLEITPVTIVASVVFPQPLNVPLAGEIIAGYTPDMHTIGVSYDLDPLLLSCDVVYKKWSDYAYSDTEQAIYAEANRERYGIVGIIPDSPDFKDTYDIHLGAEYKLNDKIRIMAGFQRKPSPVPDQSGKITNYIDMDQNIYSVGGSYHLNKTVELTGAFRYFTFDDLTVDKTGVKGITWGESSNPAVKPAWLYTQNSYEVSGSSYMIYGGVKLNL